MSYEHSGFMFNEDDDNVSDYSRKKSFNSTEYSYKTVHFYEDPVDQYLVLDRNAIMTGTGDARLPHIPRKKPICNPEAIKQRNKINAKKSR